MKRAPGSFRDPGGGVYEHDGNVYRIINNPWRGPWDSAAPFLRETARQGLTVPFEETSIEGAYALKVNKIPFISYPYEWSHDQLRDAGLLTLKLQKLALERGLILKDASAYNIQFSGGKPVFIDHFSFEKWEDGRPWAAYRQFCSHFVAPLALSSVDARCGLFSRLWIDGLPLDLAAALLPFKKRFNPGLYFHLFLHARMQKKYEAAHHHAEKASAKKFTAAYLMNLADSLARLLAALGPPKNKTEWGDYYDHTNYSPKAAEEKEKLAQEAACQHGGGLALDLGANDGRFARIIAPFFNLVAAADLDPAAVNENYLSLKKSGGGNILPLVLDLSNPSPALGFNNEERPGFMERGRADFVLALALVHHLRITFGIPMAMIADFFHRLLRPGGVLMLEFVPKEDSQTQKLLAFRPDVFDDYNLENCLKVFSRFTLLSQTIIGGTSRHMLLLKKEAQGGEAAL